jgi:hypothetical protein
MVKTTGAYAHLVAMISAVARRAGVNLFPRFALMEHWVTVDEIDWVTLIGPDELHQTEFATNCVTKALEAAIVAPTSIKTVFDLADKKVMAPKDVGFYAAKSIFTRLNIKCTPLMFKPTTRLPCKRW